MNQGFKDLRNVVVGVLGDDHSVERIPRLHRLDVHRIRREPPDRLHPRDQIPQVIAGADEGASRRLALLGSEACRVHPGTIRGTGSPQSASAAFDR